MGEILKFNPISKEIIFTHNLYEGHSNELDTGLFLYDNNFFEGYRGKLRLFSKDEFNFEGYVYNIDEGYMTLISDHRFVILKSPVLSTYNIY
jgi:hypothetical protein